MRKRGPIVLERRREDVALWAATAALVVLGCLMVLNTSYFYGQERFGDPYVFMRKHLLACLLGGIALVAAWRTPLAWLRRATYPLLVLVLLALVAVLVPAIGVSAGGATRWLAVPGLNVQPSEVAKLALVLYLAHSLTKKGDRVRELGKGYLPHLAVGGTLAALVVVQPDYGTAVLMGMIVLLMLVANGARWLHIGMTGFLALPVAVWGAVSVDYRWQRLVTFLDPWQDPQASGFQLVQSLIAFGSGGLFGVGLGAGRQKMFYLPGAHTDFIFSVVGEEIGLVGTLAVIALFVVFAVAGFRLAWKHHDAFAANLALGITALIVMQATVNMAVAVGLVPTKGIPLPFVSYGGSALVVNLAEVGILLAVAREAKGA